MSERMPVILVVYDAPNDRSYWIHIQGYFQSIPDFNVFAAPATITVHIPMTNIVGAECMKTLFRLRDQALAI